VARIRIGAPDYLSSRPLVFGLTRDASRRIELSYHEPSQLCDALDRGALDAALIPSIEYLRGVGRDYLTGPALVAQRETGSLIFATDKPLDQVRRVAVDEFSRTPVAVLRIVLDRLHHCLPDFCVEKNNVAAWHDRYDGVLLTGDRGVDYLHGNRKADVTWYDLGEMWYALEKTPLVVSLWAYNDESLAVELRHVLTESRDFGLNNLSLLAAGLAHATAQNGDFLREYFNHSWGYNLGADGELGLRQLETWALQYQLIQHRRLERAIA